MSTPLFLKVSVSACQNCSHATQPWSFQTKNNGKVFHFEVLKSSKKGFNNQLYCMLLYFIRSEEQAQHKHAFD